MLDISIKELSKAIKTKKASADFIRKRIIAVEKIDGTKLTLVRNDEPFDPNDYTKNWIVAYKGNVIYPSESTGLEKRGEEIKASALGTSQYKFVHDHLAKVHSGAGSIPENTEFFIEFVQNKPTVTRDYAKKHGMFLVGYGPTDYVEARGHLYTTSNFKDDEEQLERYREILKLGAFPVVFDGNLSSRDSILTGCVDDKLKGLFSSRFDSTDFSDPQQIVSLASAAFSELESSLGGAAEGVVIKVGNDDMSEKQLYKVLSADQHDKGARSAKKSRFKGTEEEESRYWDQVNFVVDELLDNVKPGTPSEMLRQLASAVYGAKDIVKHPIKSRINVQEDILLTAKMRLLATGSHRAKKIAVIPMAAKPFHKGHDELIKQAILDKNDSVIVFLSTGGREEITTQDMVPLWKKYYYPGIQKQYGDKVVVRFSDSPMREAALVAADMAKRNDAVVSIYGDPADAEQRAKMIIEKNPALADKIIPVAVERSLTGDVSGTQMRNFIVGGDKASFTANLPSWMPAADREGVWKSLRKEPAKLGEHLLREYVKLLYGNLL